MQKQIARTQYQLEAGDLGSLLALARAGSLAAAAERLGVDASTVFRNLQRIERGLGRRLFERGRAGYRVNELGAQLLAPAEQLEQALESARSMLVSAPAALSGDVRITSTDSVLHGLIAPCLRTLQAQHPLLGFELHTGNELASLTRRDADLAVRATRRPPPHLVGRCLGGIRVAVYGPRLAGAKAAGPAPRSAKLQAARLWQAVQAGRCDWVAPDDALPEHPSVLWRRRQFPKARPRYRVSSILTVLELVAQGLGVGVVPIFLAQERKDLLALSEPLPEAETDLWLLMHPEARHQRRVATVFAHLAQTLRLP